MASRTWFIPVSVWNDYSSFNKLLAQKSVKDSMFFRWGPEPIRIVVWSNYQFTFCTRNFAKIRRCCERWETNLGDTGSYDWELERFHISNAGTQSISHSLHNLTNNFYVTANKNSTKYHKRPLKIFLTNFVSGNFVR